MEVFSADAGYLGTAVRFADEMLGISLHTFLTRLKTVGNIAYRFDYCKDLGMARNFSRLFTEVEVRTATEEKLSALRS